MKAAVLLLLSVLCVGCDPGVPVPPLCMAARSGDTARIAELVKSGADVNQRGGVNDWTALMHAVHKNQPGAVRALIDAGADVNATAGARGGTTALRLAETEGLRDIAAVLRPHGARGAANRKGAGESAYSTLIHRHLSELWSRPLACALFFFFHTF